MSNTDQDFIEIDPSIEALVKEAGGYCPCAVFKTPDTLCPCKDFRETAKPGEICNCGRYKKQ